MGPVHHRALDGPRRASLLKKDKQGVASTVGTIMALMVFIAFMALITNSYVPAWMLDNERTHMNQVADQFGQLKNNVDSMIVQQLVTKDSSIKMFAPIKLGSEGVPLFATPTVGLLSYVPQGSSTSGVSVRFIDADSGAPVNGNGGGRADLYVPNRYYVPQWVCYENGAIIVKQDDGQSVKAMPDLNIQKDNGGNVSVDFTEIDLIGANQSLTGSDAVGFSLDLIYVDAQSYVVGGDHTLQLNITTVYGAAWYQYLEDYLENQGLGEGAGADYTLSPTDPPSVDTDSVTTITLTLNHVTEINYNRATMSMTLLTT